VGVCDDQLRVDYDELVEQLRQPAKPARRLAVESVR
jgi:hypothetical protein